jgi:hypothetical protein
MADKHKNDGITPYNHMLHKRRKDLGLDSIDHGVNYNIFIDEDRKDVDNNVNYENQLKSARLGEDDQVYKVTEKQLNTDKKGFIDNRDDRLEKTPANPINLLDQVSYNENVKKLGKSKTSETVFDEHDGEFEPELGKTKIKTNNPKSTQLNNRHDRFKSLDKDLSNLSGVKREVTASLIDADAMLFHIFLKSAMENRSLNNQELDIIHKIEKEKENLL